MKPFTYLALGDSYTIGEAVPVHKSFPYQLVQLLRKEKINMVAPEVIAKTGWTTDELFAAINEHQFLPSYDLVTLLIGVNNQYRGRTAKEYQKEFENLLQTAIAFAGNSNQRVFVLSIPDYSVTPFAQEKDVAKIEKEIAEFNKINQAVAEQYGVYYIYITAETQLAKTDATLLAEDGLHPSAKAYLSWAQLIAEKARTLLSEKETSI